MSSQQENSLPILSSDYETETTLLNALCKSKTFLNFIQLTASYFPVRASVLTDRLHRFYFIIARAAMCVMCGVSLYLVVLAAETHENVSVFFWLANLFDYASVIPGHALNQIRLHQNARLLDSSVLDPSLRVVQCFGIASFCTVVFGMIAFGILMKNETPAHVALNLLTYMTEFVVVMYLAFNLLFLIIDLQVSSLLLDQLDLLVDSKSLTMKTFNIVRDDIHRRNRESQWATDIVIAPCAASALSIVAIVYNMEAGRGPFGMWESISLILLMLKELLFLGIAFWYVSKVNEKADAVTRKLSRSIWCPTDGYLPDVERLSIYASSLAEPITFTLLFKRLSWRDVLLSSTGFGVTVFIGLVKYCLGIDST